MKRFEERLAGATSVHEIGRLVMDAAGRLIGFSSAQFAPLSGETGVEDGAIYHCEVGPNEVHLERFVETFPLMQKEILSLAELLAREGRSCNLEQRLSPREYRATRVYNEYMRPFRVEREIVVAMGDTRQPLGFICTSRSAREKEFTSKALVMLERIRDRAERALLALRTSGGTAEDIQEILFALDAGLPVASVLFDAAGHLLWLSQEAVIRLELVSGFLGSTRMIVRNDQLEALRKIAVVAAASPATTVAGPYPQARQVLRPAERMTVRVLSRQGEPPTVLISILEALPAPFRREPGRTICPGLTTRENEVTLLAAQGYSVVNIAARLNIAEATVKTHLKRIYRKLDVCSRAELTWKLLSGGPRQEGDQVSPPETDSGQAGR